MLKNKLLTFSKMLANITLKLNNLSLYLHWFFIRWFVGIFVFFYFNSLKETSPLLSTMNKSRRKLKCEPVSCYKPSSIALHRSMIYDLTDYILDYAASEWPQQVKFTLPWHLFTRLRFPDCTCSLDYLFITGFAMFMD